MKQCDESRADVWAQATDMVDWVGREARRHMGGWHGGHAGHGGAWAGAGWGGPRRQGPPPWVQDLVRSFGGPEFGPQRGPKVRRGDVRLAILDVLAQRPASNGYAVIQQIQERSGGAWKPSAGSVYPTIQQLEDEGLVVGSENESRRLLELTAEGREYVEEHADEIAATWRPFDDTEEQPHSPAGGIGNLRPAISQTMSALWQVMTQGTDQQRVEAIEILNETRRKLYGLLAEAEGDPE